MDHRYLEIIKEGTADDADPHSFNFNELMNRHSNRNSFIEPYDITNVEIDNKIKSCIVNDPETINKLKSIKLYGLMD